MATASIDHLPETFVDISCSWTGFKAGLIQLGIHAAWHVEGRSS